MHEHRMHEQSAPLAATVNSCDIFVSRITCILAKMQGAGQEYLDTRLSNDTSKTVFYGKRQKPSDDPAFSLKIR